MRRQHGQQKKHARGIRNWMLAAGLFSLLLLMVFTVMASLEHINRTPRELAPYIERRVSGHNPTIVGIGKWAGEMLRSVDRMEPVSYQLPALNVGVQAAISANANSAGHQVMVGSVEQALLAIQNAKAGDVITFLPGVYRFAGGSISVINPGRADAPIIVRAQQAGTVKLELWSAEGFVIMAPFWTFENLHLRGVCKQQAFCDHAFHVVGKAHHFVARNNSILDFNAHFKVNQANGFFPDNGLIEHNTLSNTGLRNTDHSVTVIDIVAASGWRIRRNLITDFIKNGSDNISYGVFAKGAGSENRIEQNIVICEHRLHGVPGQRVGLSLGGGGTGPEYCRDHRCITEQDRSVIDSNLVMSCSDDGIYLNKAAASHVNNNTLLDTGGIEVRFAESSADVVGNLVDGKIRSRDGGLLRASGNHDTGLSSIFVGYHPVRMRFRDPAMMDLSWRNKPEASLPGNSGSSDLCGASRVATSSAGAFDNFMRCLPQMDYAKH